MNPQQKALPLVSQLLRHAAGVASDIRFDLLTDAERELRWVYRGGLRPLLLHASLLRHWQSKPEWAAP